VRRVVKSGEARRAKASGLGYVIGLIGLLCLPLGVEADVVHVDTTIIQGSVCVGVDCLDGEMDESFDTFRLNENNLRIKFEDSSGGTFPSNDWSIVINDSIPGGESFFAIVDDTSGNTVLKLCAVGDNTCTSIIPGTSSLQAGTTNGTGSTALGAGSEARRFDTAVGFNARVTADSSVAVGANTTVSARNSVAVGANAQVLASAPGSVALGQGSIASEPNTVSVGSPGLERRITNVADGVNSRDAVNRRQLDGVGALASAFSALTANARSSDDTQVSLGIGVYKGSTALAGGVYHYLSRNILLNAGVSIAPQQGEFAGRAGVTFGW
jgi:hypothetical protein